MMGDDGDDGRLWGDIGRGVREKRERENECKGVREIA
jgi:hypothetical protein